MKSMPDRQQGIPFILASSRIGSHQSGAGTRLFVVDMHLSKPLAPFIRKQGCPEFDFKAALQ
jgi:hypothetical protein